jgi:DNA recombination protein RmuC
MDIVTLIAAAASLLAVALLLFRRRPESAPAADASVELATLREQLRGRDAQLEELRSALAAEREQHRAQQARVVQLSTDLARAGAGATRAVALEEQLRTELSKADTLTAELRKASVAAGQLETASRRVAELDAQLRRSIDETKALTAEKTRLAAELEAAHASAAERAAEAERAKEQVRAEIRVIADRLLDDKTKVMLERSHEGLRALLGPVGEKLKEFETKIQSTYDQENRDRSSLLERLKQLQETQAKLHEDAESLSRALTGESKAQGDWGELVLERVLETAGLTEGREYALQVSHTDEDGARKRPDAVVYLPANRAIVVDAKCSLTAFVESMRAIDPDEREQALDRHLASVRGHVKGLAAKNYQGVLAERTLDIVLLFVPNEAAFHAAICRDAGLYEEAFRAGVVVCSPTTLLAALQLISHVWRSEKQNTNAQKIAEEAGKLLEKLSSFVEDLDNVGDRIKQADKSYTDARNKLVTGKGNVLRRATELVKLGARVVRPEKIEPLMLEAVKAEDAVDALALSIGGPEDPPVRARLT